MMSKLYFKQWFIEVEAPTVGPGGGAGSDTQKAIEDAISQAPPGEKVDAAKSAVEKLSDQERGQDSTVKDNITLAAAQDKIAKEVGNMNLKKMKKKMKKK